MADDTVATVDAPQSTAMIPLQDPGSAVNVSSAPPSGVQPIGTPGTAMVQQPTQWTPPQPGQVDTVQSPQPDAEIAAGAVHQNWLARILDSVGTILGGDKTIVATKHPDGSVSVEHNPSTTGEKWGRIAQAALGGAARGMAAGQGPGGAAKAFAAGGLAGLQMPAQQLAAANEEAKNMNAQQLAAANIALTHQKLVGQMLDNRASGLTLGTSEAAILQQTADAMGKGPNTKDLGTFTDMQGIMRALQSNPDAMSGLTNQGLKVVPGADTEGHVLLHAYLVDRGEDNRKNDKVEQDIYTDVDPQTGAPTLKSRPINPQSQPLVEIRQAQQTNIAKYFDMLDKYKTATANANKKDATPFPKSAEEAQGMAAVETDPVLRQKYLDAVPSLQHLAIQQKEAGREPTATPGFTAGTYVSGVNPVLDDTAEGLASGRYLQSTLPKRTGKGQPTPQEQNYAANIVSQQKYGLPYNSTIIDQENTFAKAPKTQAYLEGIDRMTGAHGDPGQLNQLLNLAQAAGIGGNAPLNDVKQAIRTKLGSAAADNFATLLTETQSNLGTLIGNPLLGSGESDQKLRTAQGAFGQNPTLDSLRGQAATVTDVLTRARNNMAANNRYIQQRYGTRLSPGAAATSTTSTPSGNTGQAAQVPATGYTQGVNSAQFPINQNAQGKKVQWNGTIWTPLP